MSRDINIGYRNETTGTETPIELRPPYYLFGCQETSKRFWNTPRLKEVGITRLTELGVIDPIYFIGWEKMEELGGEIRLLQQHMESIEFHPELKAQWLSHLIYCYYLLIQTAPKDSIPELTIG